MTVQEKINLLRDKLNKSIMENDSYDIIYNLSVDLDHLIATYYKTDTYNKVRVS